MKNTLQLLLLCLALVAAPAWAQGQKPRQSPADSAMGRVGKANVKIKYGSPSVKGRQIWGALVPYDQVWRSGANEATTVSVDQPVSIEGKTLPAGTYTFFTIPGKDTWTVIFNKEAGQWGAYKYDEKKDALRLTLKPTKLATPQERLRYVVTPAGFALQWESLELPVPMQ